MTLASDRPQYATAAIPSLDGLRAIAVLLVFFAHSGVENIIPGGLGVTIFFVLSGYLITTLMRIEQSRSGSISYRGFYLRRLLRLLPPLFSLPEITLLQGFGLLALCRILFGGFGKGGGGGGGFEKHMTKEDRERMRQRFCEKPPAQDVVIEGDAVRP